MTYTDTNTVFFVSLREREGKEGYVEDLGWNVNFLCIWLVSFRTKDDISLFPAFAFAKGFEFTQRTMMFCYGSGYLSTCKLKHTK